MTALPSALARSAWRRWFLDRTAEFWLGELRPTWSLHEMRARVREVRDETADTKTFVLVTPRTWPGHIAGQYVPVDVEIDGVRTRRCYSISSGSSAPGAGTIEITVKRVAGGKVSSWMHAKLRANAIVRVGLPAGDFTLRGTQPLLLIGAGSGITPIMAMVRELALHDEDRDVIVIAAARTDADAIFATELAALAQRTTGLTVVAHRGPLDAAALQGYAPDLATREIYVCGPAPVMEMVAALGPAHLERFAAPAPARSSSARVHLAVAGRTVDVAGGTLLEGLERAGVRPAHGCRMGICNSCRCTKRSGTVEDLLTGEMSSEPDQEIRLCVSAAHTDLELAL